MAIKKFKQLSDDINIIEKEEIIKLEDGEYTILGIHDVTLEEPKIKNESIIINADFAGKDVKRNDTIWITAMVQKKNVSWSSMAVFKCRITDMYQGLSILNSLK